EFGAFFEDAADDLAVQAGSQLSEVFGNLDPKPFVEPHALWETARPGIEHGDHGDVFAFGAQASGHFERDAAAQRYAGEVIGPLGLVAPDLFDIKASH